MIDRIYYIVKSELHYFPPCVSQIRMLKDMGADVRVVYGSCDAFTLQLLKSQGIPCIRLCDIRGKFPGKLDKVHNWLSFRRAFRRFLKTEDLTGAGLWFGNAETLLPVKGLFEGKYPYLITFLELMDCKPLHLHFASSPARGASACICCEETRAYLMQYRFRLSRLPFIMPNKAYDLPILPNAPVTTDRGKEIMEKLRGRKFIIYQGIFQQAGYLRTFAAVLREVLPDYCLVLMGLDTEGIGDSVCRINPNTIVSGYIPAPRHLEITSHAEIGLLFYAPDSLNNAFCAPNKIYEYSGFGLPMLGNRIPGLCSTIERSGAGLCVDFEPEALKEALRTLLADYSGFSARSRAFYAGTDNRKVMAAIAEAVGLKGLSRT